MHLKCYQCTSCGINPVFTGLSPTYGQVTYALLTRAPVSAPKGLSLDLHVLGLSLAFILSQDQTLRCILFIIHFPEGRMVRSMSPGNQVLTVKLSYSTYLVLLVFLFGLTLSKIVCSQVWGVNLVVSLLAGAKIEHIFRPCKYFRNKIQKFFKIALKTIFFAHSN